MPTTAPDQHWRTMLSVPSGYIACSRRRLPSSVPPTLIVGGRTSENSLPGRWGGVSKAPEVPASANEA